MAHNTFRIPADPRAVLYLRISSYELGGNDAATIAEHEATMRRYAADRGWRVVGKATDLDVSGTEHGLRLDRPGILEIRDMIAAGEANIVLVAKADRLARSVVDYKIFLRGYPGVDWPGLIAHGATAASADGIIQPDDPENLGASFSMELAEHEARLIRQRTGDGTKRARRDGLATNAAPYGYAIVRNHAGRGKVLAVDPDEHAVVIRIVTAILGRRSLSSIERELKREGILTRPRRPRNGGDDAAKRGFPWTIQTIRRMVTSPSLLGRQIHLGRELLGPDGLPRVIAEPLITEAQWHAVRELVTDPRVGAGDRPARNRATRIFSGGYVQCGSCGSKMRAHNTVDRSRYRCANPTCPAPATVSARALESLVTDALLMMFGPKRVYRRETVEHVDTRRADALRSRAALTAELDDDETTDERADEIQGQLRALRKLLTELPTGPTTEVREVWTGDTVESLWRAADLLDPERAVASRRAILAGFDWPGVIVQPASAGGELAARVLAERADGELEPLVTLAARAAALLRAVDADAGTEATA